MEQDRSFTEQVWAEEVRLDEEFEDWVEEVGEEEAAAYADYISNGGKPKDWYPDEEEEDEEPYDARGINTAKSNHCALLDLCRRATFVG